MIVSACVEGRAQDAARLVGGDADAYGQNLVRVRRPVAVAESVAVTIDPSAGLLVIPRRVHGRVHTLGGRLIDGRDDARVVGVVSTVLVLREPPQVHDWLDPADGHRCVDVAASLQQIGQLVVTAWHGDHDGFGHASTNRARSPFIPEAVAA
jgi:hypothetical protein